MRQDSVIDIPGNAAELRRCVRDLVAISALPAVWTGEGPDGLAESLAEMLLGTLRLDFDYVWLRGDPEIRVARADGYAPEEPPAFGDGLERWLKPEGRESTHSIPNPLGAGWTRILVVPIGRDGESGVVVAGSRRPEFPAPTDRLLLGVAANQVAVSMQSVRLLAALREADRLKEQFLTREQAARAEAEAASRAKDEFLATVSHELRTPLTSILGWVRLLRAGNLDEKGQAAALETIERNAKAQAQLIEQVLDVSRIITGRLRLEVRPVELASVVESAIESLRPAAEANAIRLQTFLDRAAGPVSGDAGRLQQVTWNLLSNAIKFTPWGGRVTIRLERINSHVELSVSDTGKGIGPDFLPYLFDRFRQADASSTRRHGGLGLGLATVRHLVELHGGTVCADSRGEGKGATFTIRLPLAGVGAPRTRSGLEMQRESAVSPKTLSGLEILVVEHEPDTRDLLATMLESYGARVVAAASGGEALRRLENFTPDLMVSDIGMPGEDGYELIRRVRALGAKIPAIALTAYTRPEDRARTLSAGYQMHLSKPVDPAELAVMVANAAGRNPGKAA